jgi:agmatinase
MVKPIISEKDINKADVVLVSAAYEKTVSSHKGTKSGPKKVIEQLNTQIEFFDRQFKVEVNSFVKIAHKNLGNLDKLSPEKTLKTIRENCGKLVKNNKFIFLLGGEHSISFGFLQALTKKYNPKDVTILQIDAHCDLRNDDSDYNDKTPSPLAHSTVMRRASELGYNLVQVGIRTYSKEEYKYFSNPKNRVKVFEWGNKTKKQKPTVEEILKEIKTKYLYLTIDVDGFDPAFMPGTGTPVQGGLEWWYGMSLIEKAINTKELIGADIVEVSPMRGSVLTEYGAAQLLYTIVANKFKKKLK